VIERVADDCDVDSLAVERQLPQTVAVVDVPRREAMAERRRDRLPRRLEVEAHRIDSGRLIARLQEVHHRRQREARPASEARDTRVRAAAVDRDSECLGCAPAASTTTLPSIAARSWSASTVAADRHADNRAATT
jgi:hypothetical protein